MKEKARCRNGKNHDFQETASLIRAIKACAKNKDLETGGILHVDILQRGLLEKDPLLASTLISMYAKCGALLKAKEVLEGLPAPNVITWNALLAGYVQGNHGKEALDCFEKLQQEGISPNEITFICILKACSSIRAIVEGENIHSKVVRDGLLGGNVVLGNALVDMYAKCGALAKARKVLENLSIRDAVTWNALITGYTLMDYGKEALNCLEQMQYEGLSPNVVTFICSVKACGKMGVLDKGEDLHSKIGSLGLLGKSVALGNALVDMYARCGAFAKAKEVLDELAVRDVVTWSSLVAGYANADRAKEAMSCFEEMQHEGVLPDAITYLSVLKACGSVGALDKGKIIHVEIIKQGFLLESIELSNALVDMYAKCGALMRAKEVLEGLPVRDVNSWSTLISGYVQGQQATEALASYEHMQEKGLCPNAATFCCILKACGSLGEVDKGISMHSEIVRQGLLRGNVILGGVLVDMYVNCGDLVKAKEVFDGLPVWDAITWSALITGYAQQGYTKEALHCFELMQYEGLLPNVNIFSSMLKVCGSIGALIEGADIHFEIVRRCLLPGNAVLGSALVDMYARCGALCKAKEVLEGLSARDVVTWSALITGYAQGQYSVDAINCLEQMQFEGLLPNAVTFASILKACGSIRALDKGFHIHSEVTRHGLLEGNAVLGSALVDMYAKCGALEKAKIVLEGLSMENVGAWNALIGGYVEEENGRGTELF